MAVEKDKTGGDALFSFSDIYDGNKEFDGHLDSEGEIEIYSSVEQLPEDPKPGELNYVRFAMFRTGTWEHPWYGKIDFDRDYLDNLKINFDRGVVPRKIAYDLEHERNHEGTPGWMHKLELRDGKIETPVGIKEVTFLDVVAAFNSFGTTLLKDRRYAYCSAEIHPDFTTNEQVEIEVTNKEGKAEQTKTVLSHGPTVIGCALTNRPFIPSLGEVIEFSDDPEKGGEYQNVEMSEDEGTGIRYFSYKKVDESDLKSFSSPPAETESTEDTPDDEQITPDDEGGSDEEETAQYNQPNEGKKMKFAEVMKKVRGLDGVGAQLDYLKEARQNFSEDERDLVDELIETKEFALAKEQEAETKVQKAVQRKRQAEKQAKKYADEKADLEIELAEAREGDWEQRVQLFAADLRDNNHHESVVKAVTTKLSALDAETRSQKFTVLEDGEEQGEESILDILNHCFSAIPETARLTEGDKLQGNREVEVQPEGEQETENTELTDEEKLRQRKIEAYSERFDHEPPEYLLDQIDPETGKLEWGGE